MSKDDSNDGFLAKVARFVRHPTTSWADLDTRSAERESEYSKTALKEMIERKRRNDFVRKREFDALRKIRNREGPSEEGREVRPSFFQSSLPSKLDDRLGTLKKIDEIEAQMSMQWWKTKAPESLGSGSTLSSGGHSSGGTPLERKTGGELDSAAPDPGHRGRQYMKTVVGPLDEGGRDPAPSGAADPTRPVAPTQAPPHRAATKESDLVTQPAVAAPAAAARTGLMAVKTTAAARGANPAFSASSFFTLDVYEIAQDPEVEEAAIRFANGDDAGAEQVLLEVLDKEGRRGNQVQDWLTLFDLYRASGQIEPFESRAVDFVNRFSRSAPQWYDMPRAVADMTGKVFRPASGPIRVIWACEPGIDAHAVGTLQSVLLRATQPWVLDWSALESIDVSAARALLGMFALWGEQKVELRFLGASVLRDLLKTLTPSGRRDVEQLWWELRMAVLRVMNRLDEFELTALDFCVTYEVSPPGWERPRCRFQALVANAAGEPGRPLLGEAVLEQAPSGYPADSRLDGPGSEFSQLGLVELSGEIRGDPQATLQTLEQRLQGADVMIISCRHLIRVDFSAAGTLLNWVLAHQVQGRMVQFVDVHRLVAAFFHIIGITECAKVVLRND